MNFDKIKFIKMGKHIKVFNLEMEKINFTHELSSPFGNEKNANLIYVNWTIDDLLEMLETIELEFYNHLKIVFEINSDWSWTSSVRKNSYGNLLRSTNKSLNVYEKNKLYNVTISIDSIWLHKQTKTFGILWIC